MIYKALSLLHIKKFTPRVYSEVVSSKDTSLVVDMLRVAAKRANEDQHNLANS